jgi:hypothetical protein
MAQSKGIMLWFYYKTQNKGFQENRSETEACNASIMQNIS